MKWLRLYHDILNDPKIMMLSEEYRWRYIALLCVVSSNDSRGKLPDINATFTDQHLNNLWFSLKNESSNPIIYSWDGNITQEQWDSVGNGLVTIEFFADDKAGNIKSLKQDRIKSGSKARQVS